MEDAVKISIVEALKGLFSCSVNPIISKKMIMDGIVLDLTKIDLLNVIDRCPLDGENDIQKLKGSFFYFGTEGMNVPDQLEGCSDLNAVIWFVKHRGTDRTVWYGWKTQGDEHELLTIDSKPSVEQGVITMEYSEKASQLKNSKNEPMNIQVPHGNCLHVFLGNAKGVSDEAYPSSAEVVSKINDFNNVSGTLSQVLDEINNQIEEITNLDEKNVLQCESEVLTKISDAIKNGTSINEVIPNMLTNESNGRKYFDIGGHRIEMDDYTYTHTRSDIANETIQIEQDRATRAEGYSWREPEQNYYYHKTLFEFNTDYIMSVKFFDSKVVASHIVDILTGCFGVSLNLSFEERLIQNEVKKMLSKIIETSDTVVSDCFFSFSNDDYNMLVDESEKERLGEYTGDNSAYGSKIDYNTIYEELNDVSNSATLSEQVTTINHAFNEISRTIKSEIYTETQEWKLNYEFLNNIMEGLALSMVYNIISPKIYMLMAINLKIMGKEPNFDITTFLEIFKTMIIDIIRGITDKIMEEMKAWLVSLVKDLVIRLSDRLLMEQGEYYIRLLTSCLRSCALMWSGGNEDWDMADVNYADIYSNISGDEVVNTKC